MSFLGNEPLDERSFLTISFSLSLCLWKKKKKINFLKKRGSDMKRMGGILNGGRSHMNHARARKEDIDGQEVANEGAWQEHKVQRLRVSDGR